MASPSKSRATKRRRSSMTELTFHGIHTSRRTKAESVTHVSGTKCHLCLGPLTWQALRALSPASTPSPAIEIRSSDPGRVVRRCLVGIETSEISGATISRERRKADRTDRDQWCGARQIHPAKIVAPSLPTNEIPRVPLNPAIADIDKAVASCNASSVRNKRHKANEKHVTHAGEARGRHVVVGGNDVAHRHAPGARQELPKVQLRTFGTCGRVNAHQSRRVAFDCCKQGVRVVVVMYRSQTPQTCFGAPRIWICVYQPAMTVPVHRHARRPAVRLPHRDVRLPRRNC